MIAPLLISLALAAPPTAPVCSPQASAACGPAADPTLAGRVEVLLGAIDRPVPAEAWRRLPPGALALLEATAGDPSRFAAHRARALEAAALLGSDGAVHRRLASDATAPFSVRAAAIRALPGLGPAAPASALLGGLLAADPDLRIRATAAEAMARSAPATACAAVRAQAARERSDQRPAFRRAIAACDGR